MESKTWGMILKGEPVQSASCTSQLVVWFPLEKGKKGGAVLPKEARLIPMYTSQPKVRCLKYLPFSPCCCLQDVSLNLHTIHMHIVPRIWGVWLRTDFDLVGSDRPFLFLNLNCRGKKFSSASDVLCIRRI